MQKHTAVLLLVLVLLLIPTFSLAGFAASSSSAPFDDFNDGVTDNTQWLVNLVGNKPSITEEGGQLVVTLPADSKDAADSGFFGAAYISVCPLTGDFDLQVDYTLMDWPAGSGVRVALSLDNDQATPRVYNASRIGFGATDSPGSPREVYSGNITNTDNAIVETDHLSGTLRLTRSGVVLTNYYREGGNWVHLDSAPTTDANLYFGVSVWSHNYAFAGKAAKVAFDNLVINQGRVICPEEKSPTPTPTTTPVSTPESIPATSGNYSFLPLVMVQPSPTATPTSTPTSTPKPTATPTATPTTTPDNFYVLKDGTYTFDVGLDEGNGAWIYFHVTDSGTRATSGVFLVDRSNGNQAQRLYCYRTGFSFNRSVDIKWGKFSFVDRDAAGRLDATFASLSCFATSSSSAKCTTKSPVMGDQFYWGCGAAIGTAVRQ